MAVDPDDREALSRLIESESVRVLRRRGDLIITETRHGFVCANAGVDLSNVDEGTAALLPLDPDRSARRMREASRAPLRRDGRGHRVRHLRPHLAPGGHRRGHRRGRGGRAWSTCGARRTPTVASSIATEVCVADELAGAAELVMGKARGVPAAVVRGVDPAWLRRPRWPPRSCGRRPRTSSADSRPSGARRVPPAAQPAPSAASRSATKASTAAVPGAELGPRLPPEVDAGPARVEAVPQQLAGRSGRRSVTSSTPAPSAMTAASWLTEVSVPVPMLQISPPPVGAARTKASTTSST